MSDIEPFEDQGLLLTVDIEKAFDSVNLQFLKPFGKKFWI